LVIVTARASTRSFQCSVQLQPKRAANAVATTVAAATRERRAGSGSMRLRAWPAAPATAARKVARIASRSSLDALPASTI